MDANQNGNAQAYPILGALQPNGHAYKPVYDRGSGLTKRELFAAMALQGLLVGEVGGQHPYSLSRDAVAHADALLAELAKEAPSA